MSTDVLSCTDHIEMATGYLGWHAQADWLRARRYRQVRCPGCDRFAIVVDRDGRLVRSFYAEFRGEAPDA